MPRFHPSSDPLRILVTGGSGFLGAHIVARLLEEGFSVGVFSRQPKHVSVGEDYMRRLSYHAGDVNNRARVTEVISDFKPHAIVHAAAPHHTAPAVQHQQATVEGTRILLDCASNCPETRAFIYTSSDSAIVPTQTPLSEENAELYTASHYPNTYACAKALADGTTLAANSTALATAVLRVPVLYGEYDNNFIPQLLKSIRNNERKLQIGSNEKLFEFLYVKKAAEAHVLAVRALLDQTTASGVAGEAFFVSDGRPELFFDFSRRCYAAAGSPVSADQVMIIPLAALQAAASIGEWLYWMFTLGFVQPKLRRHSIDHLDRGCCWNIDKAKQKLGYEPIVDQDGAIRRTMKWAMVNL